MEVIVMGAGIAGLAAADALSKAGIKTTVLEARDRIGGRIHTLYDPTTGAPIELGAEFVHGCPPEIFDTADKAGLEIVETGGSFWYSTADGHFRQNEDEPPGSEESVWDRIEKWAETSDRDISFDAFLVGPDGSKIAGEER